MRDPGCDCGEATHPPRRVAITGGPGAGKTAVLEFVQRFLCEHVVVLPEAAGILYGGGFPRRESPGARRAAQLAIYHVQVQLERLAMSDGSPALVLCDRGVLDGTAYWPGDLNDFFREARTTRSEALARYDTVIHLRTPHDGGGYNHRNPLRVESAAEALALDARLLDAWEGHPHRVVINAAADFRDKLDRTVRALRDELPPCCRTARTLSGG